MTDARKIALIRGAIPVTRSRIYFNAGAVGPLADITVEVLNHENTFELERGRSSPEVWESKRTAKTDLRQALARLVKAAEGEIALTNHTTAGMNIVTHGLAWQPGDEIVTTNLEHPGGLIPLYVVRQRYGVVVKVVEISAHDSPAEIVARLEAAITPRTRLLAYSHVAWNLGIRLPLEEIVAMGHRHGVLSLVDGAQSTGAIPLDLPASEVDFYAMPGQKWLCGPEGTGGLYIRKDRINLVNPTFVGYPSLADGTHDWTGYFMPAPGAQRYEIATVYSPGIKAMVTNLNWLEEKVGWAWIYDRIAQLADYLRAELSELPGVTLITPRGDHAGLTSFTLDGYDPQQVLGRLSAEGIILRTIKAPFCLRVSTGFYNTEAEVDRLVGVLQKILKDGPGDSS